MGLEPAGAGGWEKPSTSGGPPCGSGEDQLLYPLLPERVTLDANPLDRMDAQHAAVDAAVTAVRADLPAWSATGDATIGERMAAKIECMLIALVEHLSEEEAELLPIVSANVTQAEWDQLAEHGLGSIPPKRRLVPLGHILDETDDTERTRFLLSVPAPARLAYRLIGKRQFAREAAAIRR
jgi:hypothetical protein